MNNYPCQCEGMKWMVDHNEVFKKEDGEWVLAWIELDRSPQGTNIERFGIRFSHCLFCGERINN